MMLIILIASIAVAGVGIVIFILTSEKPVIPAVSPVPVAPEPPSVLKVENPSILSSIELSESPYTPKIEIPEVSPDPVLSVLPDLPKTEIPFVKAGPNKRVCAYLLDITLISLPNSIVLAIGGTEWGWVLPLVYILLKDSLTGQSIGKMIVGIQVVSDKNQPMDATHGMMRNIFLAGAIMLVNINKFLGLVTLLIVLVEYFSMTSNKDGQRMGDKIGHTKVSDLKPQISDKTFLLISIVLIIVMPAIFSLVKIK